MHRERNYTANTAVKRVLQATVRPRRTGTSGKGGREEEKEKKKKKGDREKKKGEYRSSPSSRFFARASFATFLPSLFRASLFATRGPRDRHSLVRRWDLFAVRRISAPRSFASGGRSVQHGD